MVYVLGMFDGSDERINGFRQNESAQGMCGITMKITVSARLLESGDI